MSRVKFTFVNPGANAVDNEIKAVASWPPLGILYLATILRENGVRVSVLDQAAKGLTAEETVGWIEKESPDIVGFSTMTSSCRSATSVCDDVKAGNPDVVTVFGNYHATFNADRLLRKYPSVDIVVRGEGEMTVLDLVDCLIGSRDLGDVPGISYRRNGEVVSNPDRPLIDDLDALPFPDRGLVDYAYRSNFAGFNLAVKKFTTISTSRGCVHNCRFCSCQKMARGRWRARTSQNVVEELALLEGEGYGQLTFIDDCFTLDPGRVREICGGMREEGLDLEWACEGRVDAASPEMFREMARAGCRVVYFGIESANQRILDYYNKRITPSQARRAVETARRAGIDIIVGSFLIGAPIETREEIRNTLDFAARIPIDVPNFNLLNLYTGTDIWRDLIAEGVIDGEKHWESEVRVAEVCPGAVPIDEVKEMVNAAILSYPRRIGFILRQIARTLRSPYRRSLLRNNLTLIKPDLFREMLHG